MFISLVSECSTAFTRVEAPSVDSLHLLLEMRSEISLLENVVCYVSPGLGNSSDLITFLGRKLDVGIFFFKRYFH